MGKTMLNRKFKWQNAVGFDEAPGVQRRPAVVMPSQSTEARLFNRVVQAIEAFSAEYWTGGRLLRNATAARVRRTYSGER